MKKTDDHVTPDHSALLAGMKLHEKVDFYLHRPVVEYTVIFLIIFDAILVTSSLLIEIKIIEVEAKYGGDSSHDSDSEGSSHDSYSSGTTHSSYSSSTEGTSDDPHKLEKLHHAAEALHYSSLAILTIFMVEVFLKLYGQRVKFFKRKLQVIDSFVVAISFALDIAIVIIDTKDTAVMTGLGLIIILRLWRLVRIINGAVFATKERLTEKIHEEKRKNSEAKEHIHELEVLIEEKDREIEFLKGRLGKYEPIEMVPNGSTRLPAYLPETREFPKQVLGDVTDDEDYRMGFSDIHAPSKVKSRPVCNNPGTAFQAYQPGAAYQATSQYPETTKPPYRAAVDYHINDAVDTADESDVASIKPSKARSGNTFTVKKDGVPMTSL